MPTSNYSWNDDLTDADPIDILDINTTLDDIDTDIKAVRDGISRRYRKYTPDNHTSLVNNTLTDFNTTWTLQDNEGTEGTVTMISDGHWNLSEGLWYVDYYFQITTTNGAGTGFVEAKMRNFTQTTDLNQSFINISQVMVSGIDQCFVQRGFFVKSLTGASDGENIDPTDGVGFQVTQQNNFGSTFTLLGDSASPPHSSWVKFLYVRPL